MLIKLCFIVSNMLSICNGNVSFGTNFVHISSIPRTKSIALHWTGAVMNTECDENSNWFLWQHKKVTKKKYNFNENSVNWNLCGKKNQYSLFLPFSLAFFFCFIERWNDSIQRLTWTKSFIENHAYKNVEMKKFF